MSEYLFPREALGRFRANSVRDAQAISRDGSPYYELNPLPSSAEPVVEIRFADGCWMLAGLADLEPSA